MGFLGIGSWEILLILVLGLIILGPGKLTDFARTLGKTVRAIRKARADLTTAVTREIEEARKEPPESPPLKERSHLAPKAVSTPPTATSPQTGKETTETADGERPHG